MTHVMRAHRRGHYAQQQAFVNDFINRSEKVWERPEHSYVPHICLAISAHFGLSDTVTCRLQVGVQAALSLL